MAFGDFTVVRASEKRVLGSSGTLVTYAANEPAFEFNADGTYKGLLVEPAATNLFTYSEEYDNAAWTKSGGAITPDAVVAPDGTTTMDSFVEDVSNGAHGVFRSFSITNGVTYTYSFFAKPNGRNRIFVNDNTGFLPFNTVFDVSTGTVVAGSNARITDVGNGVYRCETTATATSTTTEILFLLTVDTGTNFTYTGDGTSGIYLWGTQLETGSVATSYIPTTSGTASRVADDISLSSASSLIGQTEGTMFVEVEWRASADVQSLLSLSDGTVNNELILFRLNSPEEIRMYIVSNGVIVTNQGASSTGYSGVTKFALAYAQDDAVLYKNGASISADSAVDLSAIATLSIVKMGQNATSQFQANMWIRSVALFPTRLSNSQLASLTTL